MMDHTLPPVKKWAVINDDNTILLVTSSRYIASWYQAVYRQVKPPNNYRIGCDKQPIFRKELK